MDHLINKGIGDTPGSVPLVPLKIGNTYRMYPRIVRRFCKRKARQNGGPVGFNGGFLLDGKDAKSRPAETARTTLPTPG